MDAFYEGYEAYCNGADIDSNPYSEGDMKRDEWDDGYAFCGYEATRRFEIGEEMLKDLAT